MATVYTIGLTAAVDRDIDRLPRDARHRVLDRLEALASNPRPAGVRALAGHRGHYRIRVGDYRVVYRVDDSARIIAVVIVAHRRDIYDQMTRRL